MKEGAYPGDGASDHARDRRRSRSPEGIDGGEGEVNLLVCRREGGAVGWGNPESLDRSIFLGLLLMNEKGDTHAQTMRVVSCACIMHTWQHHQTSLANIQ